MGYKNGNLVKANWAYMVLVLAGLGCEPSEGPPSPAPGPAAEDLSRALGVPVEEIPGEVRQYLVHARPGTVDFRKIGEVHENHGYSVGVTLPDGMEIGFRFADPPGEEFGEALGVRVERIPNETRQYLVYARRSEVDFGRIGEVHSDVGYAVGVTLKDGMQVGFRFAGPSESYLSRILDADVEALPREPYQYLVYGRKGAIDLSKLGTVHTDAGDNVGITLSDGLQIGLRFAGPSARELAEALGHKVEVIRGEFRQYAVYAGAGDVDFTRVGRVNSDDGQNVGVTLKSGTQVGFRYRSPAAVQEPK